MRLVDLARLPAAPARRVVVACGNGTVATFLAEHFALLLLVLVCATGMGTLLARSSPLPLRAALGLGIWAEALFLLAAIGQLRPVPIAALAGLSVVCCLLSVVSERQPTTDNCF